MQGSSSKIVQKTAWKDEQNLENFQFFEYLGHSEETFDHKLGNFLEKCASGLVSSTGVFQSFFNRNIPIYKKNSLQLSDIFDFLRETLSHFPSLQIFLQKPIRWWIQSFLNVCQHSKQFKKYTSCTKTKMLKFFDGFGVILKCLFLKQNATTFSSKNVMHSSKNFQFVSGSIWGIFLLQFEHISWQKLTETITLHVP